jgi:AcrR family transcriptional regulator
MERQARRAQVLHHAKRIFARKGYHQTNIADIIAHARIARGTFYLYFQNKKDIFQELLDQVLCELSTRIQRIRLGPLEPSPADQLRNNLRRVLSFVLAERELTDILLNHSMGFDSELDARIDEFYGRIAQQIQRSLDLGVQMGLVRTCDTQSVARCILGGIKELVSQLSRQTPRDIDGLVEEVLNFGLRGVGRRELLEAAALSGGADGKGDDFFSRD